MKKGDVIKVVGLGDDTCWLGTDFTDPIFRYYYDFKDKTGIFLGRYNNTYSTVLFGDEKIKCISVTLVLVETEH